MMTKEEFVTRCVALGDSIEAAEAIYDDLFELTAALHIPKEEQRSFFETFIWPPALNN